MSSGHAGFRRGRMLAWLLLVVVAVGAHRGRVFLARAAQFGRERGARADRRAARPLQGQAERTRRPRRERATAEPLSRPAPARTAIPASTSTRCRRQPMAKPPAEEPKRIPPGRDPRAASAGGRPASVPGSAAQAAASIQLGAFAESGAGRARVDRFVGALPGDRGDEQADRPVRRRHPAARRRCLAGRGPRRLPGAQGGRRKLLRRQLSMAMQAAIYGLEGFELQPHERDFFRDRRSSGLHRVQAQLRHPRPASAADRRPALASTGATICRS